MQLPNESNDLLMLEPSFNLIPLASVAEALSLPAKSTMYNFGVKKVVVFSSFSVSISKLI